jgi:hypothetical protein
LTLKGTIVAAALLCALSVRVLGQEKPLSIDAIYSTGFYSTYTRDVTDHSLNFVPFGSKFDVKGYVLMPDFLSFTAQPELNVGPQASDAGFLGGNGVRFGLTFLRRRNFPLTFHYTNVEMENVTFGGLGQVSAYSLKNRNKDIGLTWQLKPRTGLPDLQVDWGKMSQHAISDTAYIPDAQTASDHLNLDSKWERWGWNFDGQFRRQQFQTDLFTPLGVGTNTSSLGQTLTQYQANAERTFWKNSNFLLSAGTQLTSSILFDEPIDLSARYANASLRLVPKKRWKNYLRASYTSNLTSALVNQVVSNFGSGATGTIAPDQSLSAALRSQVSNLNLNATSNFEVGKGLGVYGSVDRGQVGSSNQNSTNQLTSNQQNQNLNASYFTTSAGVTYSKRLPWGNVSGQYGRDLGNGTAIGQAGTISGQNYNATFQAGSIDRIQTDFSVHGLTQNVQNDLPFNGKTFSVDLSFSRRVFGQFSGRIGGGWQSGTRNSTGNEFRTHGFTARIALDHPRLQISATMNQTLANALPIYSQLVGIDPTAALFLNSLTVIPSDYRGTSISVHALPIRKLEFTATWNRSRQHISDILGNDFSLLDARATYHFRKLQLDFGYVRAIQVFANNPTTKRGRFYVRVVRPSKIL